VPSEAPADDAPSGDAREPVEPLTDAEHTEHVAQVRELLDEAHTNGLATELSFFSREEDSWATERQVVHRDLIDEMYAAAADVPCERKAVMAGGLAGAGKTTVLEERAGVDRSQYLTINPDNVKEEMATRRLIPEVGGLSPMEASDLVHEESSHVAKLLAERALRDGKNIIWDVTMASKQSTERRLDDLDSAGYTTSGLFVDIPVEVSLRRADQRHRDGHEQYRSGQGMGGRFVPEEVTTAKTDAEWGNANRRTFEEVKNRFADWVVYDNSVDGSSPVMVDSAGKTKDVRRNGGSRVPQE
jgi:predicted kinase